MSIAVVTMSSTATTKQKQFTPLHLGWLVGWLVVAVSDTKTKSTHTTVLSLVCCLLLVGCITAAGEAIAPSTNNTVLLASQTRQTSSSH